MARARRVGARAATVVVVAAVRVAAAGDGVEGLAVVVGDVAAGGA
jgi:hypothetical protein